jgi:hypothetical protein
VKLNSMLFSCIVGLIISASTAFAGQSVVVKVSLFPVGSFDMETDEIIGKGVKTGTTYTAKELKVPLSALKTGISLRDEHMREKLLEKEHSHIVVTDISASDGKGTATINVKGKSKPVKFTYKDAGNGSAEANFSLNLPDFEIEGISFKGVGVEDEVQVIAKIEYDQK